MWRDCARSSPHCRSRATSSTGPVAGTRLSSAPKSSNDNLGGYGKEQVSVSISAANQAAPHPGRRRQCRLPVGHLARGRAGGWGIRERGRLRDSRRVLERSRRFDMVILGMSAESRVSPKQLSELRTAAGSPFILLDESSGEAAGTLEQYEAGASQVLPKPFVPGRPDRGDQSGAARPRGRVRGLDRHQDRDGRPRLRRHAANREERRGQCFPDETRMAAAVVLPGESEPAVCSPRTSRFPPGAPIRRSSSSGRT